MIKFKSENSSGAETPQMGVSVNWLRKNSFVKRKFRSGKLIVINWLRTWWNDGVRGRSRSTGSVTVNVNS